MKKRTLCGDTVEIAALYDALDPAKRCECRRCVEISGSRYLLWGQIEVMRKKRGRVQHYVRRAA